MKQQTQTTTTQTQQTNTTNKTIWHKMKTWTNTTHNEHNIQKHNMTNWKTNNINKTHNITYEHMNQHEQLKHKIKTQLKHIKHNT